MLVNGATGAAGRLAVQIAKHLGAGRVIATGRNPRRLAALPRLGADVFVPLGPPADAVAGAFARSPPASTWCSTISGARRPSASSRPSRAGARRPQPAFASSRSAPASAHDHATRRALRSSGLELLGSGIGSCSYAELVAAVGAMLAAVVPARLRIEVETAPLAKVESAWTRETGERRLVFVP